TADERFRERLLRLTSQSPEDIDVPASRVASAEQSNTSILYADRYILKLYRRLQQGQNPDVEIPRFLTDTAHFESIPAYQGELRSSDGTTLAFLQAFAPNQGDGWQWMQEELTRFYESVANCPPLASSGETASFLTAPSVSHEVREHAALSLDAQASSGAARLNCIWRWRLPRTIEPFAPSSSHPMTSQPTPPASTRKSSPRSTP